MNIGGVAGIPVPTHESIYERERILGLGKIRLSRLSKVRWNMVKPTQSRTATEKDSVVRL